MLSTVTGQTPSLSLQTSQEISGKSLRLPAESSVPATSTPQPRPASGRTGQDWEGVRRGSGGQRARDDTVPEPKSGDAESTSRCPAPGSSGIRRPRGHKSGHPHPHSKSAGLQGENTRAASFPEPNFALKNFPVQSQDGRGSPGAGAAPHRAHSPPRAALRVRVALSAALPAPPRSSSRSVGGSWSAGVRLGAAGRCARRLRSGSRPARRRQARL